MGLFNRKKSSDKDDKNKEKKQADKKPVGSDNKKDKSKEKAKKPVAKEAKAKKHNNKIAIRAYKILLRPVISEKSTFGASLNKYVFEVAPKANKVEIKKAVEEVYGVEPISVNIMNKSGKNVRFGRKFGRTKNVKKAVVTLKKGDSIKLYEGI